MSQAELEIGRTVVRTVQISFTQEEIEEALVSHVKRAYGVKLKDFKLEATLNGTGAEIYGEARTEGLAPTRKRKARA